MALDIIQRESRQSAPHRLKSGAENLKQRLAQTDLIPNDQEAAVVAFNNLKVKLKTFFSSPAGAIAILLSISVASATPGILVSLQDRNSYEATLNYNKKAFAKANTGTNLEPNSNLPINSGANQAR